MSVFLSDIDARRSLIRTWYAHELGRDPESETVIGQWLAYWAAKGGEAVFVAIYDSPEAKAFRAKRGW